MKNKLSYILIFLIIGCGKKLNIKPDSALVVPRSAQELTSILENTLIMNATPALAQMSADEYFVVNTRALNSLETVPRNSYIWNKDIYENQTQIKSWTVPYNAIFYCNNVLDILAQEESELDAAKKEVKGWALFARAYNYYSLVSIFANSYKSSSSTDMGVPLKLTSGIDVIVQRGTVEQTYQQIIKDIIESLKFLPPSITDGKRNRPSQVASNALLARVYLSMRDYNQAERSADAVLEKYDKLVDYNTLNPANASVFSLNNPETIYFSQQIPEYSETTYGENTSYGIDPLLISLYANNDLRTEIYFKKNSIGNFTVRSINSSEIYPFTGLATDEIYLIKAECLARRGETQQALEFLNTLLEYRTKEGTFVPLMTQTNSATLEAILAERRKSLVWRSLRWTDLKRLNIEGRSITVKRIIDGIEYTLMPNSPKYILPIPTDEVLITGIPQNER